MKDQTNTPSFDLSEIFSVNSDDLPRYRRVLRSAEMELIKFDQNLAAANSPALDELILGSDTTTLRDLRNEHQAKIDLAAKMVTRCIAAQEAEHEELIRNSTVLKQDTAINAPRLKIGSAKA